MRAGDPRHSCYPTDAALFRIRMSNNCQDHILSMPHPAGDTRAYTARNLEILVFQSRIQQDTPMFASCIIARTLYFQCRIQQETPVFALCRIAILLFQWLE